MRAAPLRGAWLAVLGVLGAHAAESGPVNVTVKSSGGAPVEDAVVILDPLDATPPPGHDKAVIDQVHKRFVPRVSVIRTGTHVTLPNSDQIRHQVYSFSPAKTFNLKLYAGSPAVDVIFDKPGLVILGCNIHDTMVAFVGVVDTPYFGKLPASGSLTLEVPPGRYRVRVWHPGMKSASAPQELTATAAPLALPITLDVDAARETVAPWP